MAINLEGFVRKHKEIEIGKKKWVFSELTIADFAKFTARIVRGREKTRDERRNRLIEDAKKIGDVDPMKLLEKLDKPPTDEEIEAEMDTVEGMGYMIYLSLKYHYPEIKEEEAIALVGIGDIEEITSAILPVVEGKKKQNPIKEWTGPRP